MKKFRKILVTAFSLTLTLSLSLCIACSSGNTVTAGGKKDDDADKKIVIQGAADLHISATKTDLSDYSGSVVATDGENTYSITVDDSAVKYGVQGKYELTYKYGELTEKVSVTVYGVPTISITTEYKTTYKYSEFYLGIADGITAKDCFGNDLAVCIYDSANAENTDGSLNVGSYEMTFVAVDNAGQAVYQKKSVTITAEPEKQPVLNNEYSYDVEKDDFVLEISQNDYDYYVALALNGAVIPADYAIKDDGKIVVDGDYLNSILVVDKTVSFKLLTAYGYAASKFTLTDKGIVAYDSTDLDKYFKKSFECLTDYEVPEVQLTNLRQNVKPQYKLYNNNAYVGQFNGIMNLDADGSYILEVELREGQSLKYEFSAFYNLGFSGGKAYTQKDGLTDSVNEKYNFVSYAVRQVNGDTLFTCDNLDKFEEFNGKLKALDVKGKYLLDVIVTPNGSNKQVKQTVDFTVINDKTTVLLSEKEQLDNMCVYTNQPEYTTLEYVYGNIGGRNGAIKWETNKEGNYSQTLIRFSDVYKSAMVKDSYITFDLYAEEKVSIRSWSAPDLLFYNEINGYDKQEIRFYDANGEIITSNDSIWGGKFKSQWITIEYLLPVDWNFDSAYFGITIASSGLYGNNVYLSNIKVSTESYMSDWSMKFSAPSLSISDGGLASWAPVAHACGYEYVINNGEPVQVDSTVLSVQLKDKDTFKVKVLGDDRLYFDSEYCDEQTTEIVIHHNYGSVVNGKVFTVGSEFDFANLSADYTYKTFTLYKGTTQLATATATDNAKFNETFKALKENITYTLKIESTHTEYGEVTDYLDIRFAKEGTVQILSTKADIDNGNMYVNNAEQTLLTYVKENVGGRYATFKWEPRVLDVTATDSMLRFANTETLKEVLKKDNYLVFDMYFTARADIIAALGKDSYLYSDSYKTSDILDFYDENGNKITEGSIADGKLLNKWVTVQIRLSEDYNFSSSWRGLFNSSNKWASFNDANVYISNVRASASSLFE